MRKTRSPMARKRRCVRSSPTPPPAKHRAFPRYSAKGKRSGRSSRKSSTAWPCTGASASRAWRPQGRADALAALGWSGSFCGRPERPWVDPLRMQREHPLVELLRRRRRCQTSVEVADVASSLLDVTRRAVGLEHAMSRHDCFRLQGLDSIQRSKPLVPGLLVALREIEVRVVVDAIPGYDQANGTHMQRRRVHGVGMAELDDFQRFSLEQEGISIENLRRRQLRRKLSGKARLPHGFYEVGCDLFLNGRNHGRGGERSGIGEPVEQYLQTEIVITMSVGQVDCDEILAVLDDPLRQLPRVLGGQERIDEDGIALAMNEGRCIGHPRKVLPAGGDSLGRAATLPGEKFPFQLRGRHASSFRTAGGGLLPSAHAALQTRGRATARG